MDPRTRERPRNRNRNQPPQPDTHPQHNHLQHGRRTHTNQNVRTPLSRRNHRRIHRPSTQKGPAMNRTLNEMKQIWIRADREKHTDNCWKWHPRCTIALLISMVETAERQNQQTQTTPQPTPQPTPTQTTDTPKPAPPTTPEPQPQPKKKGRPPKPKPNET